MQYGKLTFQPIGEQLELVAEPTRNAIQSLSLTEAYVSKIDETLADTAAFCAHYDIGLDVSANCVIVEAKKADQSWYAACIVLATDKADINGVVRRTLDARKVSFAPMESAISLTGMQYGGITPIGLPAEWPILIDSKVIDAKKVIVGSGIRGSKVLISSETLASLPNATIVSLAK